MVLQRVRGMMESASPNARTPIFTCLRVDGRGTHEEREKGGGEPFVPNPLCFGANSVVRIIPLLQPICLRWLYDENLVSAVLSCRRYILEWGIKRGSKRSERRDNDLQRLPTESTTEEG